MIVPMKKIAVILLRKDADSALKKLRRLGILHVKHTQPPKGKEVAQLESDLELLNNALEVISKAEFATGCEGTLTRRDISDWRIACRHIIDSWKRLDQLEEFSRHLNLQIKEWSAWGDFEPEKVRELERQDIFVRLYAVARKEMVKFPEGVIVKEMHSKGNLVYCAAVSDKKFEVDLKELELPKMGIGAMRLRLAEDSRIIEAVRDDLRSFFCAWDLFARLKEDLARELEFRQALSGMAEAGELSYISGFVPFDSEAGLEYLARKEKWALSVDDPSEEEDVPVLLRNPRWVRIVQPLFKFLEILPGYRELDISLPFLVFFSIFFGILIGDAGYGLVYFLLTLLVHRKAARRGKSSQAFFLFYLLSLCAVVWGLFTGTFFGQEWVLKAGFHPLIPALNNEKHIQGFCFFLGAFHLSLAHIWRGILKAPALTALADAGWICILWAAFFLAKTLILGSPFPEPARWLVIAGITLVLFFTAPQKNILKCVGNGMGALALSLMNNFTDVVSYVRLFAVGLAGVAIADAFNAMAGMVGRESIFSVLVGMLILVIGHGLGVILGPVSVLVHGVRLNVLEFSGHANISWSGAAYKPLKE